MAQVKEVGQSKVQPKGKGKGKETTLRVKEPKPTKTQTVAQEKKAADHPTP